MCEKQEVKLTLLENYIWKQKNANIFSESVLIRMNNKKITFIKKQKKDQV